MSGIKNVSVSLATACSNLRRRSNSLTRLLRHASEISNGIFFKTISPTEILLITKLIQNLISYKKYSSHFQIKRHLGNVNKSDRYLSFEPL
jgi:hypothetical protein